MSEHKTFRFITNFHGQSSFFNREWTWHNGIRDLLYWPDESRIKALADRWEIPAHKIWFTSTHDDRCVLETWGPTKELHEMFPMEYFFWELPEDNGYLWGLDLFGTDDEMLMAKLALPSWVLWKKKD